MAEGNVITAVTLVLVTMAISIPSVNPFSVTEETQLRIDKFTGYRKDVRPSGSSDIQLSISLTSIDTVDIKNQLFSISGWWSMRWTDSRITWTASDYGNIPILQVYNDIVWIPALVVSNSVDDLTAIGESTIPLRVDAGGNMVWNPPAINTVSCEMDITYFPFDTHTCSVQVTSFGYSMQELNIIVYGDGTVLTYYDPNGQWDLLDTWSDRDTFTEDGYTYSRVFYYFKVQRKPLYYGLNFILPVIVNALLTMFVFLLPADSGEKIGYCLTVLLAFVVILTLIAVDLPQTAKYTSILELFVAIVLIMGGLAVVLSITVLYVYHLPDEKKIPKWVKRFTRVAMVINCYNRWTEKVKVSPGDTRRNSENQFELDVYHSGRDDTELKGHRPVNDPLDYKSSKSKSTTGYLYKPQLNGSLRDRQSPTSVNQSNASSPTPSMKKDKKKYKEEKEKITWQLVASMMDGLLFRIYALFLVISTLSIMCVLAL